MHGPSEIPVAGGTAPPRRYSVTPLRRAQRDLTRSRIRDAARALFFAQGFELTTIDQIAERAGLRRPTVYLHFDDKAAILADIIEDYAPRAEAQMAMLPGPCPTPGEIERWIEGLGAFLAAEKAPFLIAQAVGTRDPHPPEIDALTQRLLRGFARNHAAFARAAAVGEADLDVRARAILVIGLLSRVAEVSIGGTRPVWLKALQGAAAEQIDAFLRRYGGVAGDEHG